MKRFYFLSKSNVIINIKSKMFYPAILKTFYLKGHYLPSIKKWTPSY